MIWRNKAPACGLCLRCLLCLGRGRRAAIGKRQGSKKFRKFLKIRLAFSIQLCYNQKVGYGGIAQLGERLNGIQEVSGSIPLISTR